MSISIYLGQIFGLYLFITSIALITNQKYYKKTISELLKNSSVCLIGSVFTLILGLSVVLVHNIWIYSWEVIITILGWIILLKGICMFLLPKSFSNMLQKCQTKYKINILDWMKWSAWFCLFVGAYLIYLIYFRLPVNPGINF